MALTDAECRTAIPGPKLEKLSDGGGLQLWVQPTGVRLWRLAYRFRGKQKSLALGVYPSVSLARARQAREDAKRLLAEGVDPGAERKRLRREHAAALTFQAIADEYLSKLKRERRAEATLAKVAWLLAFATVEFGEMPIKDVDAPLILKTLQALERRGRYESARRLRSTIGSVFRYAIATARVSTDPTYPLRGALTQIRPTPRAAITALATPSTKSRRTDFVRPLRAYLMKRANGILMRSNVNSATSRETKCAPRTLEASTGTNEYR